jgi:hypothetical protein
MKIKYLKYSLNIVRAFFFFERDIFYMTYFKGDFLKIFIYYSIM